MANPNQNTAPPALNNDTPIVQGNLAPSGISSHAAVGWPKPAEVNLPSDGTFDGFHLAPQDPSGAKLTSGSLAARFGAVSQGPSRGVSPFPTK